MSVVKGVASIVTYLVTFHNPASGELLLFTEEFELVIMIELRPKRCMGRTEFPDPERITTRALVGPAIFSSRAKWRSSSECMPSCARKVLDTADIVREAIYHS
jgi:hypothetical protein